MKIALFGNGKTGSKVRECGSKDQIFGPYTRKKLPSVAELREADVAVVFVPGASLPALMPLLLEAGIPVVSGSTGHKFTDEQKRLIADRGIPWVQASNFSLGMNLAFELARRIGAFQPVKNADSLTISEVHHVKKLDSPSGTALSLKDSLGLDAPIHAFREGDVIGEHSLELRLPGEILTVAHEALDRSVFAEGALWAARLVKEKKLAPGFHLFEKLVRTYCFEGSPA